MAKFMFAALSLIVMVGIIEASPVVDAAAGQNVLGSIPNAEGGGSQSQLRADIIAATRGDTASAAQTASEVLAETVISTVVEALRQGATRESAAATAQQAAQTAVLRTVQPEIERISAKAIRITIARLYPQTA